MNRVVVTGMGAISPIGNSLNEIWSNAKAGLPGIVPVNSFDVADIPWKMAGLVKGFHADRYLQPKELIRLDPFIHYAVAAAHMAVADAGLAGTDALRSSGVIIGSSRGGIGTVEKALLSQRMSRRTPHFPSVSAYLMPSTTISMAASYVAQKLGISGHCLGVSSACASGSNAIGEAYRFLKSGYGGAVLCGGAEAPVCRMCMEGYGAAGALSKIADPSASRPFDRSRDGFVLSEGACVLVLETYESAMKRQAAIYGEIAAYGNTTDAYHQTVPSAEGEARAIQSAIKEAGLMPHDACFISAHGTSTRLGDKTETRAIKRAFGEDAYSIPVTALKSLTGHMLAASGALEAALALMSLKDGVVPPVAHLLKADPDCDLDYVRECRPAALEYGISQSFGFGGLNSVIIFRKFRA